MSVEVGQEALTSSAWYAGQIENQRLLGLFGGVDRVRGWVGGQEVERRQGAGLHGGSSLKRGVSQRGRESELRSESCVLWIVVSS